MSRSEQVVIEKVCALLSCGKPFSWSTSQPRRIYCSEACQKRGEWIRREVREGKTRVPRKGGTPRKAVTKRPQERHLCLDGCGAFVKIVGETTFAVRCKDCSARFDAEIRDPSAVRWSRLPSAYRRGGRSDLKDEITRTQEEIAYVVEQRIDLYRSRVERGEPVSLPPQTELTVMKALLKPGDRVRINTPENPRLHNTDATVVTVLPWGCFLHAPAAAAKEFRAVWTEIRVLPNGKVSYGEGDLSSGGEGPKPSGNFCSCGGLMVRTGTCETCQRCGTSSGGCS